MSEYRVFRKPLSVGYIIGFANIDGVSPTLRYWDDNTGWIKLATSITYDTWMSFEVSWVGTNIIYNVNGATVAIIPSEGSLYFGEMIMQAFNFNDTSLGASYDPSSDNSYDAYWDNIITTGNNGNIVTNANTTETFCSIQSTIDASNTLAGHTILVPAGTYYETIVVDKALTILGPNAAIDPCVGSPVVEAIIMPPTSQPFYDSATEVRLMQIETDNVTIKGLTFNGDNPTLMNSNGGRIDAADGIDVYSNAGGITFEHNIFKNLNEKGVTGYPDGSTAVTGNSILNNLFDNIPGDSGAGYPNSGFGIAVLIYNNFYARVENNCITNVRIGIQTDNFNLADAANSRTIAGNNISFHIVGIWYNLHHQNASAFDINNNQLTTTNHINGSGLLFSSVLSSAAVVVTDNNVTGAHAGIEFWNNPTTSTVTATGGILADCTYGVFANNYDGYFSDATTSTVAISGVTIYGSAVAAIYVKDNSLNSNHADITLIVQDDCTVIGTGLLLTGILIEGSDAAATVQNNNASIFGFAIGVDVNGGSVSLYRNNITENGTGVRVLNGGSLTSATENFITFNRVDGIRIEANAGTIGGIHDNDLAGNTGFAINNLLVSPTVDATCNWYGSTLPAIVPAEIRGNVLYAPWLTSGTDNAPGTAGFQPFTGCSVLRIPVLTCPADQTVCENEPAYALTGESPSGGTYSGAGVKGGLFDAKTAGLGIHTITYSYTDSNGCTYSCTFTITVSQSPTLTFEIAPQLCTARMWVCCLGMFDGLT